MSRVEHLRDSIGGGRGSGLDGKEADLENA